MNYLIVKSYLILGSRVNFKGFDKLPANRPLIIVSNHQSTWDIPPLVLGFRNHHIKFISKRSLAKWIPSISYNLNHGGSVIIDRNNGPKAIRELINLGKVIEKNNYSACIFPEGTRSKNGLIKKFQTGGVRTLLKVAPSAILVPFVIDGNYKLQLNGYFPMSIGQRLTYSVLDPIVPGRNNPEELVLQIENLIKKELRQT